MTDSTRRLASQEPLRFNFSQKLRNAQGSKPSLASSLRANAFRLAAIGNFISSQELQKMKIANPVSRPIKKIINELRYLFKTKIFLNKN